MANIIDSHSRSFLDDLTREARVRKLLDPLRRHDRDTYEHSLRVSLLCIDLGAENHFGDKDLQHLGYAGILHDIGKTIVPLRVLTKNALLNPEEMDLLKRHARLGFLALQDPEYQVVRDIVVSHHEYKLDPYPRGQEDRRKAPRVTKERRRRIKTVLILAQIVAVSDIYDALANRRPYKEPLPAEGIEKTLRAQFTGDSKYINQVLKRHHHLD